MIVLRETHDVQGRSMSTPGIEEDDDLIIIMHVGVFSAWGQPFSLMLFIDGKKNNKVGLFLYREASKVPKVF